MSDGDRGRNSIDAICCRLIKSLKELTRVRRKTLDISPLTFGIESVESKACFPAPAHAANDDKLAVGNVEINLLQVVDLNSAKRDLTGRQNASPFLPRDLFQNQSRILARFCPVD